MVQTELRVRTQSELWSADDFYKTFEFESHNDNFFKEVNNNRYSFQKVNSPHELFRVIEIQRLAWRWSETDIAPTHILSLMEDTGGGVFGAFDENGEMVGFAAGFGGGTDTLTGKPALISSMLAVAGERYRSHGIGKELKLIQAHYAYLKGYEIMKWFYDPERGENASLNMRKLGAQAEEFRIDKYGEMKSQLYGPVPTDRFRAVWRFTRPEVVNRITGSNKPPSLEDVKDIPIATFDNMPDDERVLVQISGNIDEESEENKILRRQKLRSVLSHYMLDMNYIASEFITGMVSDESQLDPKRHSFYLLEPK